MVSLFVISSAVPTGTVMACGTYWHFCWSTRTLAVAGGVAVEGAATSRYTNVSLIPLDLSSSIRGKFTVLPQVDWSCMIFSVWAAGPGPIRRTVPRIVPVGPELEVEPPDEVSSLPAGGVQPT